VRASINIEPLRIGRARSVDCEHGTQWTSSPLHSVTQVVEACHVQENDSYRSIDVCAYNDVR
jgi:hypothetical protein